MRVQFVLSEVWIGLRRNLTMTIALVVVVAISLSLLGTGLLFVKQVNKTRSVWQSKVELSIYLCTADSLEGNCAETGAVTASQISSLESLLKGNPDVTSYAFVDQAQAYQAFKSELRGDQPIIQYTSENEIPPSLEIRLKNTEADAPGVTDQFDGAPGVADVVDDSAILNNFYRLLDGARNAVVIIALFLLVAAILLVANTIRLSAFNRRRETSIMRLVGASNFYVQLPFLAEGMIAGLVGWLVASGLLIAVKSLWLNGLQSYIPFGGTLTSADLVEVVIIALITGLLICGSTSFLTLRRYLRV
jgi:cell division transport system permease protein